MFKLIDLITKNQVFLNTASIVIYAHILATTTCWFSHTNFQPKKNIFSTIKGEGLLKDKLREKTGGRELFRFSFTTVSKGQRKGQTEKVFL
jgi:hypothetical protein